MNQEQLINQLAGLIDSLQNIKKGFSRTGGGAGRQVEVRMEGRSGTVRAKALTNIPPGECTVLRTESGEWVVVSGLNPQIIKDEIISQEQNRREKKPQKKVGNAIVPILISKTVAIEMASEPDCTCDSWRLQKVTIKFGTPSQTGIELPYKSCDGGGESYKTKEEAEQASFGQSSLFAWHYKFDNGGGTHGAGAGLPWAPGIVHCAYPGAEFYGYEDDIPLNAESRDGTTYSDIGLWGLIGPSHTFMTPERLLTQYGFVIEAARSIGGVGRIITPSGPGSSTTSFASLGPMYGYYPIASPGLFEGAYVTRSQPPNESLQLFRPLLAWYDYDEIVLGGSLEYLLPVKDFLNPVTESGGGRVVCLSLLSRGWYDPDGLPIGNTWGSYQAPEACLTGLPDGTDDLGKPPQKDGKYLMTRYYIGGLTEDLFEIPHTALRADDPNCGYISVNHTKQEIYIAIKSGADRINTQAELEENLSSESIALNTENEFTPLIGIRLVDVSAGKYEKIYNEVAPNTWNLKPEISHIYPDDRTFYLSSSGQLLQQLRSQNFPQLINGFTRCCAIHLFTIKYEKEGNNVTLSVINQATYRHGQSIPNNPNNWKHALMSSWLVSVEPIAPLGANNVTDGGSVSANRFTARWHKYNQAIASLSDFLAVGDFAFLPESYNPETLDDIGGEIIRYYLKAFSLHTGYYFNSFAVDAEPTIDPTFLTFCLKLKGSDDPKIIKASYGLYQHIYYDITGFGANQINLSAMMGSVMPVFNYSYTDREGDFSAAVYSQPRGFSDTLTAITNRDRPLFLGSRNTSNFVLSIAFYPEIFFPESLPSPPSNLEITQLGAWGILIHREVCVAVNLVNNEIWAVDFDQRVPAIDPTTIENLNDYIDNKRERDEDGLRWKLLYNDDLITAEIRIVIPTPDTTLEDGTPVQMNKTIFQEGLNTATAKIYPLKFTPGTDRGFTVWGAAPAPWQETLE